MSPLKETAWPRLRLPTRRRWQSWLGMVLLLGALAGGALACGGGSSGKNACTGPVTPGTTAGAYTITVTGTSAGIMQTGTVTLTVR